jgi:pentatricopeptide repeat protein
MLPLLRFQQWKESGRRIAVSMNHSFSDLVSSTPTRKKILDDKSLTKTENSVTRGEIRRKARVEKKRNWKSRAESVEEERTKRRVQSKLIDKLEKTSPFPKNKDMDGKPGIFDNFVSQQGKDAELKPKRSFKNLSPQENAIVNSVENNFEEALERFNFLKTNSEYRPQKITYDAILRGHGLRGEIKPMKALVREMEATGVDPNISTFHILANTFATNGRIPEVFEILKQMENSEISGDPKLYSSLMETFRKQGKKELVFKTFELMKQKRVPPDTISYNIILNTLLPNTNNKEPGENSQPSLQQKLFSSNYSLINKYFKEMCTSRRSFPSVITFGTLMRGAAEEQNLDLVLDLYQQMKTFGVTPNTQIHNSILRAFGEANRIDDMMHHFYQQFGSEEDKNSEEGDSTRNEINNNRTNEEIQSRYRKRGHRVAALLPNQFTYSVLGSVLCDAGRPDEFATLVDGMHRYGLEPNLVNYNVLIGGYAKLLRAGPALKWFEKMQRSRHSEPGGITTRPDRVTFHYLVQLFLTVGDLNTMNVTLKQMEAVHLVPSYATVKFLLAELQKRGHNELYSRYKEKYGGILDESNLGEGLN